MKKAYINKGRILTLILCALLMVTFFASNTSAVMGMPGSSGRNGTDMGGFENGGGAIGTDRNGPSDTPKDEGNLGDKDGDGVIEDKGEDGGIGSDIMDMGSEIISDAIHDGSEMIDDIESGMKDSMPETHKGTDSGMAGDAGDSSSPILGIVIAALVAIALVILIVLMIPRSKNGKK